jgi:hypothetical protein
LLNLSSESKSKNKNLIFDVISIYFVKMYNTTNLLDLSKQKLK